MLPASRNLEKERTQRLPKGDDVFKRLDKADTRMTQPQLPRLSCKSPRMDAGIRPVLEKAERNKKLGTGQP